MIEIKLFHFLFYLCWYGGKVPCSVKTEDRAMTLKFCISKHWYSDNLLDGDRKGLLADWMARKGRFSIILCKCKIDINAYHMFLFGGSYFELCQKLIMSKGCEPDL